MKKFLDSTPVWIFLGIFFPLASWSKFFREMTEGYTGFDTENIIIYSILGLSLLIIIIKEFIYKDLFN
jgi:hypothetical protein